MQTTPQATINTALMILKPTMNEVGQQLFPIVQNNISRAVAELTDAKQRAIVERDAMAIFAEQNAPQSNQATQIANLTEQLAASNHMVAELTRIVSERDVFIDNDSRMIAMLTKELADTKTSLSERIQDSAEVKRDLQRTTRMYNYAITEAEKYKKLYNELKTTHVDRSTGNILGINL